MDEPVSALSIEQQQPSRPLQRKITIDVEADAIAIDPAPAACRSSRARSKAKAKSRRRGGSADARNSTSRERGQEGGEDLPPPTWFVDRELVGGRDVSEREQMAKESPHDLFSELFSPSFADDTGPSAPLAGFVAVSNKLRKFLQDARSDNKKAVDKGMVCALVGTFQFII